MVALMAYPDSPHFRFPFKFTAAGPADVMEQDSSEDIAQCVEIILRFPLGMRIDIPEFGISDQTFREKGPDLNELRTAIARWEPRADIVMDQTLDELIGRAHIKLRGG